MMDDRLLVISPVRNEARHIERVVRAMAAQERPPDRWVVVDDGSTDGTLEWLLALRERVPFMEVVARAAPPDVDRARDRLARAAAPRAFNDGLRRAADLPFTHVMKLDGDIELPAGYLRELLGVFAREPRLGLAGGDLLEEDDDGRTRLLRIAPTHVHGALKCYTAACFAAIGGMQERLGWDTIDETYARMRGFETRRLPQLVALHHRALGSADGTLRGRARHGTCAYVAHFGPGWVALRAGKLALTRPRGLSGVAFLFGYARAAALRVEQVPDPEFRRFVRREQRRRIRHAVTAPVRVPLVPGRRTGCA